MSRKQDDQVIYLHWSATGYHWTTTGKYHSIVQGDGTVKRMHSYSDYTSHTWRRNSNAIGMAIACMGGIDYWKCPPTKAQIEALCKEVADFALNKGWKPEDISIKTVMTHAEAASNLDGRWLHDNYGPTAWGGTGERWDLMVLEDIPLPRSHEDPHNGGNILRQKIRNYMMGDRTPPTTTDGCIVVIGSTKLDGVLLSDNRSYVSLKAIASAYSITVEWNPKRHSVDLSAPMTVSDPKYASDSPPFPSVDVFLNTEQRPFMQAVDIKGSSYVRVADFANELSLPIAWDGKTRTVTLGDRLFDAEGQAMLS